ncbi:hypothetical protein FBY34_7862 [Streptomyces sp. SLBN-115]|nr:hypothetical protein FBY34_7862 [Streptomyces sp. SLBN-115]
MTTPFDPPVPPASPAPVRPGRKLGPIAENVGSAHRAWLEPMRETYLRSGLTLSELSLRVKNAHCRTENASPFSTSLIGHRLVLCVGRLVDAGAIIRHDARTPAHRRLPPARAVVVVMDADSKATHATLTAKGA